MHVDVDSYFFREADEKRRKATINNRKRCLYYDVVILRISSYLGPKKARTHSSMHINYVPKR